MEKNKGEFGKGKFPIDEQRYWDGADKRFLAAWKQAIEVAGPEYFALSDDIGAYVEATDKAQVIPIDSLIRNALKSVSVSDGTFLLSLLSFHNPIGAQRLFIDFYAGRSSIGDVSMIDLHKRRILAELMLNFSGW